MFGVNFEGISGDFSFINLILFSEFLLNVLQLSQQAEVETMEQSAERMVCGVCKICSQYCRLTLKLGEKSQR